MKRVAFSLSLLGLGGCQEPPPKRGDRVAPPKLDREPEQAEEFRRQAHEEALTAALPLVRAALIAGDPFGAWQTGQGPASIPLLTLGQRAVLEERVEQATTAVAEINEAHLNPASVVVFRAVRFGIARLEDQLGRRTPQRRDPLVVANAVEQVLDELVYRTLHDDCDASCEALASELALALPDTRAQLVGASLATTEQAVARSLALAQRSRELARRSLLDRYATLRTGLGQLADALDSHQQYLQGLADSLRLTEPTRAWTDKPNPIAPGAAKVERLPDVIGPLALSRRMAAEELIILDPERDVVRIAEHVRRWQALRVELVAEPIARQTPTRVDVARCEAALTRIGAGLAGLEGVAAPRLGCDRYLELTDERVLDEAALTLELLELGVIEPQRRALRGQELAELALIGGQWSTQVHSHLRRVMLLARIDDSAARARAIDQGLAALCLAEAALWVHAELTLPLAARDAIGSKCAALGDANEIRDRVLADPRGALAGFGLSLIGDEPARMVGFDRFFWAPLGLMQTLATPIGMHPDQFTTPDDPRTRNDAPVDVKIEQLGEP